MTHMWLLLVVGTTGAGTAAYRPCVYMVPARLHSTMGCTTYGAVRVLGGGCILHLPGMVIVMLVILMFDEGLLHWRPFSCMSFSYINSFF